MKVEQAKQIVSKAIEELSQALERGYSETLRNYLVAIGRIPSVQSTERDADRVAEANGYARRWFPHVEQPGTLREEGRKRHFDSRSDRSTEEPKRGTKRNR